MEIIKDALTARKDFMTLLSTAPPPFPPEIESKLKGLKLGSPSTVPGASSSIPQASGSATLAPAPQNLVSTAIPPASAVASQPVPTATPSVAPQAPISAAPQGAPILSHPGAPPPTPRRSNQSPPRNSSADIWKLLLVFGLLVGGVYLFRRYQQKKEEEKK